MIDEREYVGLVMEDGEFIHPQKDNRVRVIAFTKVAMKMMAFRRLEFPVVDLTA